ASRQRKGREDVQPPGVRCTQRTVSRDAPTQRKLASGSSDESLSSSTKISTPSEVTTGEPKVRTPSCAWPRSRPSRVSSRTRRPSFVAKYTQFPESTTALWIGDPTLRLQRTVP